MFKRVWVLICTATIGCLAFAAPATANAAPSVVDLTGRSVDVSGLYCAYYAPTKQLSCASSEAGVAAARSAVVPASSFLMGEFYDDTGYSKTHGYIDWFDSAACSTTTSDVDSGWSDTTTWRSRISSYKGFSGCWIAGYELTNYGGAVLGYAYG